MAYKIKKWIGYGNVYKIKGKKAVRYDIRKKEGIKIVMELINGRLRKKSKVDKLYENKEYVERVLPVREDKEFNNKWLAGFTDADGCFHIGLAESKSHKKGKSLRLEYSLKQKGEMGLLKDVKEYLKGGNVSEYKSQEIGCYKSTGSITAYRVIRYFDEYKLESSKYVSYIKFRKVYRMMTRGEHLTEEGIRKIERIRSKGSSEIIRSTNEVRRDNPKGFVREIVED